MAVVRLTDEAARLLDALRRAGAPVAAQLADGLSADEIDAELRGASIALPAEVRAYFGWRNGLRVDRDRDEELFPGGIPLSLREAIGEYHRAMTVADRLVQTTGMPQSSFWDLRWLPLFHNGAGDYHVTLVGDRPAPTAPVLLISNENRGAAAVGFDSLSALLRTIAACFDAGAYRIVGGRIADDRSRSAEVVRLHNPQRLKQAVEWLG